MQNSGILLFTNGYYIHNSLQKSVIILAHSCNQFISQAPTDLDMSTSFSGNKFLGGPS